MKKSILSFGLFSVAISLFTLFNSCSKESATNSDAIGKETVYTYIIDNNKYQITVQEQAPDSFIIASNVNDTLAEVLNSPTSALLKDPFNKNTYYAFKTVEESEAKNEEILMQLNQYELKYIKGKQTLTEKAAKVGQLKCYQERYFAAFLIDYTLTNDSAVDFSNTNKDDKLSSYRVYSNTSGPRADGKRYVIIFYENRYSGKTFKAYSYFEYESGNDGYTVCWSEENLHGLVRSVNWLTRKYWGDAVTSIKWELE